MGILHKPKSVRNRHKKRRKARIYKQIHQGKGKKR